MNDNIGKPRRFSKTWCTSTLLLSVLSVVRIRCRFFLISLFGHWLFTIGHWMIWRTPLFPLLPRSRYKTTIRHWRRSSSSFGRRRKGGVAFSTSRITPYIPAIHGKVKRCNNKINRYRNAVCVLCVSALLIFSTNQSKRYNWLALNRFNWRQECAQISNNF